MSEPFELGGTGNPDPQRKQELNLSSDNVWDKIKTLWNAIWSQSLYIRRHGETQVQLPLPLAIFLAVIFPHAAVPILVIGVIMGFSITVAAS